MEKGKKITRGWAGSVGNVVIENQGKKWLEHCGLKWSWVVGLEFSGFKWDLKWD